MKMGKEMKDEIYMFSALIGPKPPAVIELRLGSSCFELKDKKMNKDEKRELAQKNRDLADVILHISAFRQQLFSADRDLSHVFAKENAESEYVRLSVRADQLLDMIEDPKTDTKTFGVSMVELSQVQEALSNLFQRRGRRGSVEKKKRVYSELSLPQIDAEIARLSKIADRLIDPAESPVTGREKRNTALTKLEGLQKELGNLERQRKVTIN